MILESKNKINILSKILCVAIHFFMILAAMQINTYIMQLDPHVSFFKNILP